MSTNINPDNSPARRPTGVMSQGHDGNYANNPNGMKHVRWADGVEYGPMDDDDLGCE